ncbi:uncharacterized protein LOC121386636 isoform X2 [Gigantopelta aegis]|uniref:uncharacterized protein LOC121386636 isoform X2 n=1 Tax=Gigantopelta aegis TaxID=1735272 RepID=UPI001B88D5ED|nr:uncharacterized protein LOC121386636 isoform X2 [Gigantopelta aegis]
MKITVTLSFQNKETIPMFSLSGFGDQSQLKWAGFNKEFDPMFASDYSPSKGPGFRREFDPVFASDYSSSKGPGFRREFDPRFASDYSPSKGPGFRKDISPVKPSNRQGKKALKASIQKLASPTHPTVSPRLPDLHPSRSGSRSRHLQPSFQRLEAQLRSVSFSHGGLLNVVRKRTEDMVNINKEMIQLMRARDEVMIQLKNGLLEAIHCNQFLRSNFKQQYHQQPQPQQYSHNPPPSTTASSTKPKPPTPPPKPVITKQMQTLQDDSEVEFLFEEKATEEQVARARKFLLPDHFYLYENKPPCPGCIGCEDEDRDKDTTDASLSELFQRMKLV